MQLTLASLPIAPDQADVLVVGLAVHDGQLMLCPGNLNMSKELVGRLVEAFRSLGATGEVGQVTKMHTFDQVPVSVLLGVGLGERPEAGTHWDDEVIRQASGAAVRSAGPDRRVMTALALVNDAVTSLAVEAVAVGAALGAYEFRRYRSARSPKASVPSSLQILVPEDQGNGVSSAFTRAIHISRAIMLTRDLVSTPAADLHPADLAEVAKRECGAHGCIVDVSDAEALVDGGFGGIVAVGQGAAEPPCLVRIEWVGDPESSLWAHLVGKGITFDSGGLSLKGAEPMALMKVDMAGAAAVIGTMLALALLEIPVNVIGWVAAAENMPSGAAYRPSDVLTMRNGSTVEVVNTDSEGRLVLADALSRSAEESPAAIVDIATLTGAQLVALGDRIFGVMANDESLRDEIVNSAASVGEQAWPMPLPPQLKDQLKSRIADTANTGGMNAGMMAAGVFLEGFVPPDVPWAHLDVAGPALNLGDPHGYVPTGATGVGVRTLLHWLEGQTWKR